MSACGCFVFCTREAYVATGGFSERMHAGEDLGFVQALKKAGRFVVLKPKVVTSGRKLDVAGPWDVIKLALTIAGVRLQLLYTPGETADTISVWLPDKRVLMTGDDFFRAFPNISPIRGARPRSPEDWIASLEKMISLQPDAVVPSHTRPVLGAGAARTALTAYRDGIKSILDQTLQGMKQGERPD